MEKRGRYAKGEERREEILEAAFTVLARDGYRGASLGQIGRSIGIESAHIVYYFGTRDDLLQEVLRRWDQGHLEDLDDASPLDTWMRTVRRNQTSPGLVQLYTIYAAEAVEPEHPAHEYFLQRFTFVQNLLVDAITQLQEAGSVDPTIDATRVASRLVSLSDGLQVRWLVDRSVDMVRSLSEALSDELGFAPLSADVVS